MSARIYSEIRNIIGFCEQSHIGIFLEIRNQTSAHYEAQVKPLAHHNYVLWSDEVKVIYIGEAWKCLDPTFRTKNHACNRNRPFI